jgi:undecaprenyl-diphosphatase
VHFGFTILLGLVQGLTEFLPVSSDGHLALAAFLVGVFDMPLSFVVVLHIGTLIATLLVFRSDVGAMLRSLGHVASGPKEWLATPSGALVSRILVASVPTAVIGLLLDDAVEEWSHDPRIVGACLLLSAAVVASTRLGKGERDLPSFRDAILIGVAQGLAVLPGLTRSGSTIAMAMLLGMSGPAAFRFSFLMSLPAVGGAILLKALKPDALAGLGPQAALGTAVAFVSGLAALLVLRNVVKLGKFWAFALYLAPLGLGLLFFFDRIKQTP